MSSSAGESEEEAEKSGSGSESGSGSKSESESGSSERSSGSRSGSGSKSKSSKRSSQVSKSRKGKNNKGKQKNEPANSMALISQINGDVDQIFNDVSKIENRNSQANANRFSPAFASLSVNNYNVPYNSSYQNYKPIGVSPLSNNFNANSYQPYYSSTLKYSPPMQQANNNYTTQPMDLNYKFHQTGQVADFTRGPPQLDLSAQAQPYGNGFSRNRFNTNNVQPLPLIQDQQLLRNQQTQVNMNNNNNNINTQTPLSQSVKMKFEGTQTNSKFLQPLHSPSRIAIDAIQDYKQKKLESLEEHNRELFENNNSKVSRGHHRREVMSNLDDVTKYSRNQNVQNYYQNMYKNQMRARTLAQQKYSHRTVSDLYRNKSKHDYLSKQINEKSSQGFVRRASLLQHQIEDAKNLLLRK